MLPICTLVEQISWRDARQKPSTEPFRLCTDCRFAKKIIIVDQVTKEEIYPSWTCLHPSAVELPPRDPVTGFQSDPRQIPCRSARESLIHGRCGRDARHWEPAEVRSE